VVVVVVTHLAELAELVVVEKDQMALLTLQKMEQ
jgi:hypothetical protein